MSNKNNAMHTMNNLRAAIQDAEEFGLVRDEAGNPLTGVVYSSDGLVITQGDVSEETLVAQKQALLKHYVAVGTPFSFVDAAPLRMPLFVSDEDLEFAIKNKLKVWFRSHVASIDLNKLYSIEEVTLALAEVGKGLYDYQLDLNGAWIPLVKPTLSLDKHKRLIKHLFKHREIPAGFKADSSLFIVMAEIAERVNFDDSEFINKELTTTATGVLAVFGQLTEVKLKLPDGDLDSLFDWVAEMPGAIYGTLRVIEDNGEETILEVGTNTGNIPPRIKHHDYAPSVWREIVTQACAQDDMAIGAVTKLHHPSQVLLSEMREANGTVINSIKNMANDEGFLYTPMMKEFLEHFHK